MNLISKYLEIERVSIAGSPLQFFFLLLIKIINVRRLEKERLIFFLSIKLKYFAYQVVIWNDATLHQVKSVPQFVQPCYRMISDA